MAKFKTKAHIVDKDGNLITPGTEVEESQLGDAEMIKRYLDLDAIEASTIVSGEATDEDMKKAVENVEKDVSAAKSKK